MAASAASQPYGVEQQLIRQASKDNRRRGLEKTACFGHLVQNGAFGAVRFYFRSHVTLYRVDLCDYRVIPVTMPHPRKIKKVVRFGAFWCMPGAKPSKFGEFRGSVRQMVYHGCMEKWCIDAG